MKTVTGQMRIARYTNDNDQIVEIDFQDDKSGDHVAVLKLDAHKLMEALIYNRSVSVTADFATENAGNKRETSSITIHVPRAEWQSGFDFRTSQASEALMAKIQAMVNEKSPGWIASTYFRSQGQVVTNFEDQTVMVKVNLRRYVES